MNVTQKTAEQMMLEYFNYQLEYSTPLFLQRMGYSDFDEKTVLDIGCGHGALSVKLASLGAKRVVGIDVNGARIEFAKKNVEMRFPQYKSIISFHRCSLAEIGEKFDIAISKDAFEHIADLPMMMHGIAACLEEDGLLLAGFSPLYYSPFGDHGRYLGRRRLFPWLPVVVPERLLLYWASHVHKMKMRSVADIGLNKLTPKQFRQIISDQGWLSVNIEYNKGARRGMTLMCRLRKIPLLEKYFTVSIYAQLGSPDKRLFSK